MYGGGLISIGMRERLVKLPESQGAVGPHWLHAIYVCTSGRALCPPCLTFPSTSTPPPPKTPLQTNIRIHSVGSRPGVVVGGGGGQSPPRLLESRSGLK